MLALSLAANIPYMYVCMYVYMYVLLCVSTYVCLYICIFVNLCLYVRMYECMCVFTHKCCQAAHTPHVDHFSCRQYTLHVCMFAYLFVCRYVCLYVYVCMYVRMYVCEFVYINDIRQPTPPTLAISLATTFSYMSICMYV